MHASKANFFPKTVSMWISLGPKIFFTKESEPFVDKSPRWILSGQWMAGEGPLKAEQRSLIFFYFYFLAAPCGTQNFSSPGIEPVSPFHGSVES